MSVLFRVEGNSDIGMGHVMRCLALAQCMQKNHVDVLFLVSEGTAQLCTKRHDWAGQLICLESGAEEFQQLQQLITKHKVDIAVLDGYQFDTAYRKQFATLPCLVSVFDDTNSLPNLYTDLIINGAQNAQALDYERTAPEATLCIGEQFRVIRQEFAFIDPEDWENRQSLLITMGGSDVNNITLPLLKKLELELKGEGNQELSIPIRVVTGSGYQALDELGQWISETELNVQHIHECQQMAEVMVHAKLAVSAAGGSQFELLASATPSVLAVVADNQVPATMAAATQGWCEAVDCREQERIYCMCQQILDLWRTQDNLQVMHKKALPLIDIQGAERVTKAMFEALHHE